MTTSEDKHPCPVCGSSSGGFGKRKINVVTLDGTTFLREKVEVNRYRCRVAACSAVFRDGPPVLPEGARDIVAGAAIRNGIRAAARLSGYDEATVGSYLSAWMSERDADRDIPVKDEIGFVRMKSHYADIVLAYDPVDDTVLDVVPGLDALRGWLVVHAPDLRLAVVGIDPELAGILVSVFPGIRIAVPPSVACEAVVNAGRAAVSAMARKRSGNFREDTSYITIGDDALGEDAIDALRCWAPAAKVIRRTVLALLEAFSGEDAGPALASSIEALAKSVPGSRLAGLIRRWGNHFAEGVRERWIDPAARSCNELVQAIVHLRPHAIGDMVRAVVLHQAGGRLDPGYVPTVGVVYSGTSPGTRIEDALDAVRALWGAARATA